MGYPTPTDAPTKQFLNLGSEKKLPMISQQYGRLIKTHIKTALVHKQTHIGEISQVPNPRSKAKVVKIYSERENQFPPGINSIIGCLITSGQL